jgi:hypothetical protein
MCESFTMYNFDTYLFYERNDISSHTTSTSGKSFLSPYFLHHIFVILVRLMMGDLISHTNPLDHGSKPEEWEPFNLPYQSHCSEPGGVEELNYH